MTSPLLIFPAGYGDGPAVRKHAAALGVMILGGSSRPDDPARADYTTWITLPHVTDPDFEPALMAAITTHKLGQIHATHHVAWTHLAALLPRIAPQVALHRGRNNFDIVADYAALRANVEGFVPAEALAKASAPKPAPSTAVAAGFVRAAMSIPGESYEPKLLAMMEIARRAPAGDIVEIGCLFGRTAALLAMLADHYTLGNVLCVDPWATRSTEQGNAQLKAASEGFAWNEFRRVFEINVAPFARGRLNYINAASLDGADLYAANRAAESEAFAKTAYEGAIGILHIDGNHDYDYVAADTARWTPWVKPGGWIIFDDYVWDWGDGPARVADAFIADPSNNVRCSFVLGGAMFVQLAGG
jgi:SAM-dependent methyltransferase